LKLRKALATSLTVAALLSGARGPSGVQVVFLFEVGIEGAVGIVPLAEVVQFAPDLFAPLTDRMSGERKIGIGLAGLLAVGRMGFGYGNVS
jgi:hypothetical protein